MDLNDTTAIADSLKYAAGIRLCAASLWPVLACACGRSPPQSFLQPVLSTARCKQQPDSLGATFSVLLNAGACAVADHPPRDHRTPTSVSELSDTLSKTLNARGMAKVRESPLAVGGAPFRPVSSRRRLQGERRTMEIWQ